MALFSFVAEIGAYRLRIESIGNPKNIPL